MKKELRQLLKMFFGLTSARGIEIKKEISPNGRWVHYKIEFHTRSQFDNHKLLKK